VRIFSGNLNIIGDICREPVVIEDDAWIGLNAVILKGVRVGRGAVVGAGAVVTRNVDAYSIVVGHDARVIGNASP
jgi:acetyltransferase-like isoleucine patch superfamily enzyme